VTPCSLVEIYILPPSSGSKPTEGETSIPFWLFLVGFLYEDSTFLRNVDNYQTARRHIFIVAVVRASHPMSMCLFAIYFDLLFREWGVSVWPRFSWLGIECRDYAFVNTVMNFRIAWKAKKKSIDQLRGNQFFKHPALTNYWILNISVFLKVTPYSVVDVYRRFGGKYYISP
jgi:hypothetical protein